MASSRSRAPNGPRGYRTDPRWEVWRGVAKTLAGTLDIDSRLGGSTLELRATVEGVPLVLTGNSVPYRGTGDLTLAAPVPAARGLDLRFGRRGLRASLARMVGRPRVGSVWSARDLPYAEAWVDGTGTGSLVRACEGYEFSLTGGIARADRRSFDESGPRILRAVRAVASLATGGARLERRWTTLAAQLAASSHTATWPDAMAMMCAHDGMPIHLRTHFATLLPRQVAPQLFVCVRAERRGRATDEYQIFEPTIGRRRRPSGVSGHRVRVGRSAFRGWASEPARLVEQLRATVTTLLEQVHPHAVVADRQSVDVYLRGFATDAARAHTAIALAHALAADENARRNHAPYR